MIRDLLSFITFGALSSGKVITTGSEVRVTDTLDLEDYRAEGVDVADYRDAAREIDIEDGPEEMIDIIDGDEIEVTEHEQQIDTKG